MAQPFLKHFRVIERCEKEVFVCFGGWWGDKSEFKTVMEVKQKKKKGCVGVKRGFD